MCGEGGFPQEKAVAGHNPELSPVAFTLRPVLSDASSLSIAMVPFTRIFALLAVLFLFVLSGSSASTKVPGTEIDKIIQKGWETYRSHVEASKYLSGPSQRENHQTPPGGWRPPLEKLNFFQCTFPFQFIWNCATPVSAFRVPVLGPIWVSVQITILTL